MSRFGKIILILSAAVFGLIILGLLFYFGFFYIFYSAIENWVTSRLGLDFYVARLFSVTIGIALTAIFPILFWYLLFGKRRLYGALVLIGIQAGICLLVYTVGANVCFDRRSGKPLCYFADTEKGRVWSYTPGFEPKSGKPFKLFTREIRETEKEKSKK